MNDAPALLRAERLSVAFPTGAGWLTAVEDVSFSLAPGETLALVGESGSGKSATAMAVARLHGDEARVGGTLAWVTREGASVDLATLAGEALRRLRGREIAVVFQDPGSALDPVFRIGDQIAETLRHLRGAGRREAAEGAVALLDRVGIPDPRRRAGEYPHQLSGGMRQRAVIALALAGQPRLLIADEPTTALDVTIQAQILDLLNEMKERLGMAVLLITHAMGVVAETAQRVVVMYAGKVVEEAPVRSLFATPRHPYTQGLIRSIPRLDLAATEHRRLEAIPGTVPSLLNPPPGCRFAARCRFATDACTAAEPPLREVAPGHKVACIL